MKSLLIQLDEPTFAAPNRVAAPGTRRRSEFVRRAIRDAVRREEYREMREAYARKPDSASEEDDWSAAEEFRPRGGTKLVG